MPGTIQVSVLDFKGLDSSSQISLKVSIGKREYQTWDKGDFSFPLTTLRDNLIVTLQDAEGNKISHAGVETRLIVEKGVWDDIFPLDGGGHVHMKLQFVLSVEERQRIRMMRESALKKKHDELCNSGGASPKITSVGHNEVSANEASLWSMPFTFFKDTKFDTENKDGSYSIQKQKSTNEIDEKQGNSSSKSMPEAVNVHLTETYQGSVPSKLEKVNNLKRQGPAVKADSTVRNMITAFEGSLNQDKPSIKPPPKKTEKRKIGVDSFIANPHIQEIETIDQKAAFSRRMLDKHSKGNQSWDSFSKKKYSRRTLITKLGGEEIPRKDPRQAAGSPTEKLKSVPTWSDDHSSTRRSGLWIFPGETNCLCITTGGKMVMDLLGGFRDESTKGGTGEVNANASEAVEANEEGKTSTRKLRPKLENSMEPEESVGPFRQVIRVAIMVGFATLVLLTRKRT